MISGTIIKGIGGFYYVSTENGIYECRARGIFRKEKITPLVGDYVQILVLDEDNKKGSLDIIEKRRTELLRPRVANVDQAIIVFAAVSPTINLDLMDRFIVLAEEQGLDIIICINKIDLDEGMCYKPICDLYEKAGFTVIPISAKKNIGIEYLREMLAERISVFAGPSGVGKSSIINAVMPSFKLTTGELSLKIDRGKHTTRHAELMKIMDNSYIVDSPGFTSLYFENIEPLELQGYFREFREYNYKCKYTGCSHTHEPECAVKEQVGKDISAERYERYISLYKEISEERKK